MKKNVAPSQSPTRRRVLLNALLGAGGLALRSLATGLPVALLANPRKALAAPNCGAPGSAQYFILQTSAGGDPINANVPGCYNDPLITHSLDPLMAATPIKLGAVNSIAAKPWASLPQNVLDRTSFWHLMTNTPVHPKEPDVLQLMGAIRPNEMLPSVLAKQLAPCLQTIQAQPITVGASNPTEGLTFNNQALPIIPPLALKSMLTAPNAALGNLTALRDQTLEALSDVLKQQATQAQRKYLDNLILSQREVRNINQNILSQLSGITNNSVSAQITAALVLIQMKVSPVVAIRIPFGGDNHFDKNLVAETAQTISGVASIAELMTALQTANLQDQVSFISLNVFGRTLGPRNTAGRDHNGFHQVSWAIGKPFKAGVIGGVAALGSDYGATAMSSTTGLGAASGDVAAIDTLASFGKTVLTAAGVDSATVNSTIPAGKVIKAALI